MLNTVVGERHIVKLQKPLPICTHSGRYSGWAFRLARTWINGALKNGSHSARKRDEASNGQITDRTLYIEGLALRQTPQIDGTENRQGSSVEPPAKCILT